ncbi:hypothetical protein HNR46_002439 [Haloferula luteola]|uniref:Uncharacterized protein n=1 Tax=Haloferula luteola TaxID=595692 RepID=A0A840V587_9BACT|nr:hypothetical protein [Haloferula luteola]MBB5352196.1 hypothetical protein [Haloferula luteola]
MSPERPRRRFRWGLVVSLSLFGWMLLFGSGPVVWIFLIIWHLGTGWIRHPIVNLPHLSWDPLTLAFSLFATAAAVLLLHGFLRRMTTWIQPFSTTLRATGLLLAAMAAATSMIGIVHESVWLGRNRMIVHSFRLARVMALNRGIHLHHWLMESAAKGRHPRTIEDIVAADPAAVHLVRYPPSQSSRHMEPFILLQPGADITTLPSSTPILVATEVEGNAPLIIFADGSHQFVSPQKLDALLPP